MKALERRIDRLPISLRFTRKQHIDYYDWGSSSILNKDLSSFLRKIDSIIMGSEIEPLKITPLHPTVDLASKVGLEVVKATMLETENNEKDQPEKDIKEMIQKHLNEILPIDSDKELILKLFPDDARISMNGVLKETSNDLIAKACGFPSSTMFKKFIDQYDETNSTLEINATYLVSLLSQSEILSSDGFLHKYKESLRKYKIAKPGNDLDKISINNKKALDRIRITTIRNIDFFFKYSPKRSESLSSFAKRNGKHFKKFSKREINAFKKLLYSNSAEKEEALTKSSSYIPTANCNLCPSLAKPIKTAESKKKKEKKNKYQFATEWAAKISIQKISPIWDVEGVKRHWEACHGPNAITHGLVSLSLSLFYTFTFLLHCS